MSVSFCAGLFRLAAGFPHFVLPRRDGAEAHGVRKPQEDMALGSITIRES